MSDTYINKHSECITEIKFLVSPTLEQVKLIIDDIVENYPYEKRLWDLSEIKFNFTTNEIQQISEYGKNKFLKGYKKEFSTIEIKSHNGPLTLVDGELSDEDLRFASRIAARFSQGRDAESVTVKITRKTGEEQMVDISPMPVSEIKKEFGMRVGPKNWYL